MPRPQSRNAAIEIAVDATQAATAAVLAQLTSDTAMGALSIKSTALTRANGNSPALICTEPEPQDARKGRPRVPKKVNKVARTRWASVVGGGKFRAVAKVYAYGEFELGPIPWHKQTRCDTFATLSAAGGACNATFMPDGDWICVWNIHSGDIVLHNVRNHGQSKAILADGKFADGGHHTDHDGNTMLHEAPDGRGGALGFGAGISAIDVFQTTDAQAEQSIMMVMGSLEGNIAMCELMGVESGSPLSQLHIRWSRITGAGNITNTIKTTPDGLLVACCWYDGDTVRVYDATNGEERATLPAHVGPFAPEGFKYASTLSFGCANGGE